MNFFLNFWCCSYELILDLTKFWKFYVCLFVQSAHLPYKKKAFSYDLIIQIRLLVLIIIWLVYICLKKTMMPHTWKNGYKSSSRLYNYYDIHPMAKKMFSSVSSFKSSQKLMKCWMKKKENQKLLLHAYIILQHNFTVEFTLSEF